jgi:hypothetical protein
LQRAALLSFAVVVLASCGDGDDAATTTELAGSGPTDGVVADDQVRLQGLTFEVRRDPG